MSYRFQLWLLSTGLAFVFLFGGCASQQSAVVATIGDDKITLDEFNAMYAKNNIGKDTSKAAIAADRESYLDLYVKFKLKLKDAYAQGYQNDPAIQAEVQDYRRSLDVSSLIEHDITEPALHRMYENKLVNVRPRHILLQMSPNANSGGDVKNILKGNENYRLLESGAIFRGTCFK